MDLMYEDVKEIKEDIKKLLVSHEENKGRIEMVNGKIIAIENDLEEHENNHKWWIGTMIALGAIVVAIVELLSKYILKNN